MKFDGRQCDQVTFGDTPIEVTPETTVGAMLERGPVYALVGVLEPEGTAVLAPVSSSDRR